MNYVPAGDVSDGGDFDDDNNSKNVKPNEDEARRSVLEMLPGENGQDFRSHTDLVLRTYEKYVELARLKHPELSDADQLMDAFRMLSEERSQGAQSSNEVLRDAEYYAMCQASVADGDYGMQTLCALGAGYDSLKLVALGLKAAGFPTMEHALRANKDSPLSMPGRGSEFAIRGLLAGWLKTSNRSSSGNRVSPGAFP